MTAISGLVAGLPLPIDKNGGMAILLHRDSKETRIFTQIPFRFLPPGIFPYYTVQRIKGRIPLQSLLEHVGWRWRNM